MIICCYTEPGHHWSEQELADKLVLLPQNLQQQALRKKQWADRQLSITGKLLLLRVMQELDCRATLNDLKYNVHHRPYFDRGPDFNISHSGNLVVCCGTNNGRIGIDVEQVKVIDLDAYTDYFTPNEWHQINHYPQKYDGFYDFWTRKEAALKAIGTGFYTPLSSIDVAAESLIHDDIAYHFKSLIIQDDYKCHIATTFIPASVQLIRVDL